MSDKPKGPLCKIHKEPITAMWECRKSLIWDMCMPNHSGFEHTKINAKELSAGFAKNINKQLVDLDERLGRYSTTTAGKINFICTEYINGMHALVDDFRKQISKRYQMIADTFEPFQKIDEKALEMKAVADELADSGSVPEDIMDKMSLIDKNMGEIDGWFGRIGELNDKTAHLDGEIDTDLRDELKEFREYIEDLFLTFKFPMDYNDDEFHLRQGGLKGGKVKTANNFGEDDVKVKGKSKMTVENEKYVKAGNEDDIQVDIEQDFDVIEGRTYKGHSSWVRDIIRLGSSQFATCDEKGMIVLWNRKVNKQKSISATTSNGDSEAVNTICTAGISNNWLVGGCSAGSIFLVNIATSQKRMIENFMDDDVFGLTALKQYKGRFWIAQDAQFNLRVFDVEKMANSSVMANPKSLIELEIGQKPKKKDDQLDIYYGDNKLIELRYSNFGKTKKWFSTFVLSAISTTRKVNLYVLEVDIKRKIGWFKCKKTYHFSYQFLKSFKFDYAPTSIWELGEDRVAIATGKFIKVLDIRGSHEAGLMFEGHTDRIRTLAKITKKVKAYLIREGKKKKPILKDAHYIISAGSDLMIKIWKVPVVLPSQKLNIINDAYDKEDQDLCLMTIETKHIDMISALIYSKEEIITASKDYTIKMYRIQAGQNNDEPQETGDRALVRAGGYADANIK